MTRPNRCFYEFGPFRLDPAGQLWRGGDAVPLAPKVFDTLLVLVKGHGRNVEKEELFKTVWPDTFVNEGSLAQNIFQVRKALSAGDANGRYIETIPKRGYRFVAIVTEVQRELTNTDSLATQNSTPEQLTEPLGRLAFQCEHRHRGAHNKSDAYQLHLIGQHFWNKRSRTGLMKASEYFRQAIESDPGYAPAHAWLADTYFLLIDSRECDSLQTLSYKTVEIAALKALELDETAAEALAALAVVRMKFDKDPARAERAFERAILVNPNCVMARVRYALFLAAVGRLGESLHEIKRAHQLDPFSASVNAEVGLILYLVRDYGESTSYCHRALAIDSSFIGARVCLGLNYEQEGAYDEAIMEFRKAGALCSNSLEPLELLGHTLAITGQAHEALQVLSKVQSSGIPSSASPDNVALIHAALGQKDQAYKWFEMPAANATERLRLLRFDPRFDIVRSETRFKELLSRSISEFDVCQNTLSPARSRPRQYSRLV